MGLSGNYACQIEYQKVPSTSQKIVQVIAKSNEIQVSSVNNIILARRPIDSNGFPVYSNASLNAISTVISFKLDRTLYYVEGNITNIDTLSLVAENVWNCTKSV
jgi:hypothetical protein